MPNRLAHQPRHSIGAGRDETDATPCLKQPEPYDLLIENHQSGGFSSEFRGALRDAKTICGTCPTATFVKCFRDNADERWVKAMLLPDEKVAPRKRPQCGTHQGYEKHRRSHEHACDACRIAESKRSAERKAARQAKVA